MADQFASNQENTSIEQWVQSSYKFTQPVRYFKNNDPYHWEIDNIPIKQLEENILWLKDQVAGETNPERGIGRRQMSELRPLLTSPNGRSVTVQSGKFTARVNDGYNKGIQTLIKTLNSNVSVNNPSDRAYRFNLPTSVLKSIAGDVVNYPIYSNGLYEHLQHHDTRPNTLNSEWNATLADLITKIPKNKLALWRQGQTSTSEVDNLQELAVGFTRRWGGAVRTAVVNVEEDLEITIPPFSNDDYSNKTGYTPSVRVDLLFVYTHPVDAASTTLALPDSGSSPKVITKPILGILKGAGVVSLKGFGLYGLYDSTSDTSENFFDSEQFQGSFTDNTSFFKPDGAVSDEGHFQTISPISDLFSSEDQFDGVKAGFPSPDDVMNLTPLFQEGLENSFALIGQSVLPIAYIVTRRGKPYLEESDIIDIRPFLRTAELSYNERSGVAAANPPLSFANPAVGKTELNTVLTKTITNLKTYVDTAVAGVGVGVGGDTGGDTGGGTIGTGSTFITKGAVLGGTKFGVEGSLLNFAQDKGIDINSNQAAINYLREHHMHGLNALPLYPGWDLAAWCDNLNNPIEKGYLRNDRINCAIRATDDYQFQSIEGGTDSQAYINTIVDRIANNRYKDSDQPVFGLDYLVNDYDIDTVYYVRKRMRVQLPANIVDYDVSVNFRNCLPSVCNGKTFANSLNNYAGIAVEKGEINNHVADFTIYVGFVPVAGTHFPFHRESPSSALLHEDQTGGNTYDQESFFAPPNKKWTAAQRSRDIFSAFTVMSQFYSDDKMGAFLPGRTNNAYAIQSSTQDPIFAIRPSLVTYPSVEFTVIGHTAILADNYIFDTTTTNGQPTLS